MSINVHEWKVQALFLYHGNDGGGGSGGGDGGDGDGGGDCDGDGDDSISRPTYII